MKPGRRPTNAPHGTQTRYKRGCKCPECRAANAERSRYHRAHAPQQRNHDEQRLPWRYWCLITDSPGEDTGAECQLPLGHDGLHDWQTVAAVA